LRPGQRREFHKWCSGSFQLEASIRTSPRRLAQLLGEVGWWSPDVSNSFELFEPEVEDVRR